jgi:hypothetical protein
LLFTYPGKMYLSDDLCNLGLRSDVADVWNPKHDCALRHPCAKLRRWLRLGGM